MRRIIALLLLILSLGVASAQASPTLQSVAQTVTERVTGTANTTIIAHYHPDLFRVCAIREGENVLAVGRDLEAGYLVYAGGAECEGPVWVAEDADITWSSSATLNRLLIATPPEIGEVIADLPEYESICQTALSGSAPAPTLTERQTVYMPGSWSFFPPPFVATDTTGIDVVICLTPIEASLGVCPDLSQRVERVQEAVEVVLVDFESSGVITRRTFEGRLPPRCPSAASEDMIVRGNPPARETWMTWIIGRLVDRGGERLRTVTAVQRLNARPLPHTQTEVLEILDFETPVNLIARNEEATWVVALLPDMTQAWLFAELLDVAVQTDVDALPIVSGPAEEVALQMGS